jgi:hypothetical protein
MGTHFVQIGFHIVARVAQVQSAQQYVLQARGPALRAKWNGVVDLDAWRPVFAGACAACILSASPSLAAMRDKLPPPTNEPGRCRYHGYKLVLCVWCLSAEFGHCQQPLQPSLVLGVCHADAVQSGSLSMTHSKLLLSRLNSSSNAAWRLWTSLLRQGRSFPKRPALGWRRHLWMCEAATTATRTSQTKCSQVS